MTQGYEMSSVENIVNDNVIPFLGAMPVACGNSWARDQTRTITVTMPDP